MPAILDAGKTQLSNADVLDWVRKKRAQHTREDTEDKEAKRQYHRPKVFANSLRRQEQELTDDKYPYVANPGAYEGKARVSALKQLSDRIDEDVCYPLEEKYKKKGVTYRELKGTLYLEWEKKTFTLSELVMLMNLAPENVSILEMVLEGWHDRFTPEEMEKILGVIDEVCRCGDKLPGPENGKVS